MTRMLVRSWQETYRGLMPDRVFDDPGLVDARERFWTTALVDGVVGGRPRMADDRRPTRGIRPRHPNR